MMLKKKIDVEKWKEEASKLRIEKQVLKGLLNTYK
jgi:hypothetical protein